MTTPPPIPQAPYRGPETDLADRWLRLAAVLIDGFIALVVMVPLMFMGGYW